MPEPDRGSNSGLPKSIDLRQKGRKSHLLLSTRPRSMAAQADPQPGAILQGEGNGVWQRIGCPLSFETMDTRYIRRRLPRIARLDDGFRRISVQVVGDQDPCHNAGLVDFRRGGLRLTPGSTGHDQREGHQYEHPPKQRSHGICQPESHGKAIRIIGSPPLSPGGRGWNEVVVGVLMAGVGQTGTFYIIGIINSQLLGDAVVLRLVNVAANEFL